MKNINILIVLLFFSTSVFGQADQLKKLFNQYQDEKGVTSIKIAKPMFGMLNRLNIQDAELDKIKPLLSKINGLNILIIEKPTFPANLASENVVPLQKYDNIRNSIMSAVSNLKYEELITVNSNDSKIKFLASAANDGVLNDLLLNITSDSNSILLMLDGQLSMDDVSKLIEETQSVTALNPITSVRSTNNSNVQQSVRQVKDFKSIEVSTGVKLEFSQSPKTSVVVDAVQDKQQYVITEVEGGVLKVFIRTKGVNNLNINNLVVRVSAPTLEGLVTKSGSFFKTMTPVVGDNLIVKASSGSKVEGEFNVSNDTSLDVNSGSNTRLDLKTKGMSIEASSGSYVRLKGLGTKLVASISSGSSCDLGDFTTKETTVSASSGSFAKINATDALTANVSSASTVQYKGTPKNIVSDVSKNTGASLISIK